MRLYDRTYAYHTTQKLRISFLASYYYVLDIYFNSFFRKTFIPLNCYAMLISWMSIGIFLVKIASWSSITSSHSPSILQESFSCSQLTWKGELWLVPINVFAVRIVSYLLKCWSLSHLEFMREKIYRNTLMTRQRQLTYMQ